MVVGIVAGLVMLIIIIILCAIGPVGWFVIVVGVLLTAGGAFQDKEVTARQDLERATTQAERAQAKVEKARKELIREQSKIR